MARLFTVAATTLLAASVSTAVRANDSEAEIALGGVTLKHSDAIRMDSEDLYISRDLVRVAYRFTNTSDAPVDALVAFPLPEIPPTDGENTSYWGGLADLKFRTTVDGKPIAYDIVDQAIFKGKDVSSRLKALDLPLNRLSPRFEDALNKLPKPERATLVADGLLENTGDNQYPNWIANWSLQTTITRRQVFPPKATVTVEHQYVPRAGGSVGGGLDASRRDDKEFRKDFLETRKRYCIDDAWLSSFDRIVRTKPAESPYSEVWLGYVLKTGANWKGPIGDFRLVIDKGKPDSLVSFCAEGVKKISPTRFEVRHANYTPDRDLDILIVDWLK